MTTYELVSEVLRALDRDGIVEIGEDGRVRLIDPARLQRIYDILASSVSPEERVAVEEAVAEAVAA